MEVLLIYIAKVSCILAIFFAAYQLFLKKETFFKFNRYFLISGLLLAIALPFISFINYVEIEPNAYTVIEQSAVPAELTNAVGTYSIDWVNVLGIVYLTGIVAFSIKFIVQLFSLFSMVKKSTVTKFGGFHYVESVLDIAPFSFFNYIFYNPSLYSESELSIIVKHEVVHSSQRHSVDVILAHLVTIATWINPLSWLYRSSIKQNLEFLADEGAVQEVRSTKGYQYALLKVSGNQAFTPIVNTFYNSLTRLNVFGKIVSIGSQYGQVKKRIVMLNKSRSSRKNILKTISILPVLAIFMVSFNTKEVYIPADSEKDTTWTFEDPTETIKIVIYKNTTDKELQEMKKDLAEKGVDFSYTVVHNSKNEITSISIDFAAENNGSQTKSSSSFTNDDKPIDPIHIVYNPDTNSISMGNSKNVHIDIHEDDDHSIWVHSDNDNSDRKTIEIIEKNGKEVIKVNGKEVTRETYEAMKEGGDLHKTHVKIKKSKSDGHNNVFIIKDSDDVDEDIMEIDGKNGFFFIDTDGDEKTLFLIDGKESTKEAVKSMNPSDIETINVFKGDRAKKKYGKKGKHGVVEITSKKN